MAIFFFIIIFFKKEIERRVKMENEWRRKNKNEINSF